MGKKDKNKKKGKGAEKTTMKTEKKASLKQKKMLEKMGEVSTPNSMPVGVMLKYPLIDIVDTLANPI